MRQLISYLVGLGLGVGAGILIVTFLTPISGQEFRANLRQHYADALAAARQAAAEKRAALEAELAALGQRPEPS